MKRLSSFWLVATLLSFIQGALILRYPLLIFREVYFLPYLVDHGKVPYRDFFDHHGFLLYYLFAPLTRDHSQLVYTVLYLGIHTALLLLIMLILRRYIALVWLVCVMLFYIATQFFFSENMIWFEQIIALLFVFQLYLLTLPQTVKKDILLGISAALATMIKPTAILCFVVLGIYRRSMVLIGSFLSVWVIAIAYFYSESALSAMWNQLIGFNRELSKYYIGASGYHIQNSSVYLLLFMLVLSALVLQLMYRKTTAQMLQYLVYLMISLVFLYPVYGKEHFTVAVPFLTLVIGLTFALPKRSLIIITFLLSLGFIAMIREDKQIQKYTLEHRVTYFKNPTFKQKIKEIKNVTSGAFYIHSNEVELYYQLRLIPPTHYPLILPGYVEFNPHISDEIRKDLVEHHIESIVIPTGENEWHTKIQHAILRGYTLSTSSSTLQIYR